MIIADDQLINIQVLKNQMMDLGISLNKIVVSFNG